MQFIKMNSNNFEVNKITVNGVSTHLKLITISAYFTQHDSEIPASGSAVGAVFWLQGQYVDFLVSETFCSNLLSSQRSQFKVTGSQFAQIITTTVLNVQFSSVFQPYIYLTRILFSKCVCCLSETYFSSRDVHVLSSRRI